MRQPRELLLRNQMMCCIAHVFDGAVIEISPHGAGRRSAPPVFLNTLNSLARRFFLHLEPLRVSIRSLRVRASLSAFLRHIHHVGDPGSGSVRPAPAPPSFSRKANILKVPSPFCGPVPRNSPVILITGFDAAGGQLQSRYNCCVATSMKRVKRTPCHTDCPQSSQGCSQSPQSSCASPDMGFVQEGAASIMCQAFPVAPKCPSTSSLNLESREHVSPCVTSKGTGPDRPALLKWSVSCCFKNKRLLLRIWTRFAPLKGYASVLPYNIGVALAVAETFGAVLMILDQQALPPIRSVVVHLINC